MAVFQPLTDQIIQVTISGPRSNYQLDFNAQWMNNTHIFINTTIFDQLWGNELISIEWLSPTTFKNDPFGMNMINIPLIGSLFYKDKDEAKISDTTVSKIAAAKETVSSLGAFAGGISAVGAVAGLPMSSMWNCVGSLQMINVASVLDLYVP